MPGGPTVEAGRLIQGLVKEVQELLHATTGWRELVSHNGCLANMLEIGFDGGHGGHLH